MNLRHIAHSQTIKSIAKAHGFLECGISKAEFLEEEAKRLELYLRKGRQGKMGYMENHFDLRLDPSKLVPGAKTVVSLLYNYYPEIKQEDGLPKIAKYAWGRDYHKVIKKKLKHMMQELRQSVGKVEGRFFVDSAPILERQWAAKSGLGWIGKNTMLLNKKHGSFFFLAELVIDLECEADKPQTDHCGTCTACIDACPTDALLEGNQMDASKCISYFTIELKEAIPKSYRNQLAEWVFGCDICQDVCPWNRFSRPHTEQEFVPGSDVLALSEQDWMEMTDDIFFAKFGHSALKRAGLNKLKENVQFAFGKKESQ
jgi:epoxyqueuosine reductase